MQFDTGRLVLRPWQPNTDARHAIDIYGDTQVMAWVDDGGRDLSLRQVQGRLQRYREHSVRGRRGVGSWAVEQKDIGRVVGHVVLMPLPDIKATETQQNACEDSYDPTGTATDYVEIGWQFRPASWGFGYASEAATCIAQYAFEELRLPVLLAVTMLGNQRSVALMERLGMRCDGITTRYYGGQELLLYKLHEQDLRMADSIAGKRRGVQASSSQEARSQN